MSARNLWIVAGIGIIVLAMVIGVVGQTTSHNPEVHPGMSPENGSTGGTSGGTLQPDRSIPPPHRAPAQRRDEAWAPKMEDQVRDRVGVALQATNATLVDVHCQTSLCDFTVEAGDDDVLSTVISALEGPDAMSGIATGVLARAPYDSGGKRRMDLTAQFDR
jgi:hypothetical protein